MQILTNFNTTKQVYSPARKNIQYKTSSLNSDVFQQNKNPSFRGLEGLFKSNPEEVPAIVVLPEVSDDFVTDVTKTISQFPPKWLKSFRDNNYKIILSKTCTQGFHSQNKQDFNSILIEMLDPEAIPALTHEGDDGKNFFIFCDKQSARDYMEGMVNHELSHGIVNIKGLDRDKKAIDTINKDIDLINSEKKIYKLKKEDRSMVMRYLFGSDAHCAVDEIIADTNAWNNGMGCYGSGFISGIKTPNLMKELFPTLSKYLKTIEP